MPAPSDYYLSENTNRPHRRMKGSVWWFSESACKTLKGGGNQWRRAFALQDRCYENGFKCIRCGIEIDKSRRADMIGCSKKCRVAIHHRRQKGDPTVPPAHPYRRTNQEEHNQQLNLRRQLGLSPWPGNPKPRVIT